MFYNNKNNSSVSV